MLRVLALLVAVVPMAAQGFSVTILPNPGPPETAFHLAYLYAGGALGGNFLFPPSAPIVLSAEGGTASMNAIYNGADSLWISATATGSGTFLLGGGNASELFGVVVQGQPGERFRFSGNVTSTGQGAVVAGLITGATLLFGADSGRFGPDSISWDVKLTLPDDSPYLLSFSGMGNGNSLLDGTVAAVASIEPVPEPSTGVLLMGALLLALFRASPK